MAKKMNLDEFQREMDVMITKATLTIIDRRDGEIQNRDFYRFGTRFPIEQVGKELAQYGYDVVGYKDVNFVEGTLDFELMYATLSANAVEESA